MKLSQRVKRVGGTITPLDNGDWVLTIADSRTPKKNVHAKWSAATEQLLGVKDFNLKLIALETRLSWRGYGPNSSTIEERKLVKCINPYCNRMFTRKNGRHKYCGEYCRDMVGLGKKTPKS